MIVQFLYKYTPHSCTVKYWGAPTWAPHCLYMGYLLMYSSLSLYGVFITETINKIERIIFFIFITFWPQIYPKRTIGISSKTNQHISPSQVIKLLNFRRIYPQRLFLYCSTRTSKPTFWALKPKLVIAVKPQLSIMILFAIFYNFHATQTRHWS